MQSLRTIYRGAIFFAVTTVIGIVGYWMAGWDLLDAIYMVTITIYGVGYGEVRPLDDPNLRIFTMFIIIAGCSSAIYVIGGFVQMIAEGEINRALGARRMTKGIDKLDKHVIVCGYGRMGQHLARELAEAKQAFVVIDVDTERLREAEEAGYLVLIGDATEEHVLQTAGIDRARILATVLSSDTANVFITLTARELNHSIKIIARAEAAPTKKKLIRSGATEVVLTAAIGATKVANLITAPSAEELLFDDVGRVRLNEELKQIGLQMSELTIQPGSDLVGESIGGLEVTGDGGFVVVAVRHADNTFVRNPRSTDVLASNDVIVLLGHSEDLPSITRRAAPRATLTYRGASG